MKKINIKKSYPNTELNTIADVSSEAADVIKKNLLLCVAMEMIDGDCLEITKTETDSGFQVLEAAGYVMKPDQFKRITEAMNRLSVNMRRLAHHPELFRAFRELSESLSISDLNRSAAIRAARDGSKIHHVSFSPYEWFTIKDGLIVFEDGAECTLEVFNKCRPGDQWANGYKIIE